MSLIAFMCWWLVASAYGAAALVPDTSVDFRAQTNLGRLLGKAVVAHHTARPRLGQSAKEKHKRACLNTAINVLMISAFRHCC